MILNLLDFEKLPETDRGSLTCLRAIREKLADEVRFELEDFVGADDASDLVEDIASYWLPNSARARIAHIFSGRVGCSHNIEKLDVLKTVVDRIADLEKSQWSKGIVI
jgi:hypothetical protein